MQRQYWYRVHKRAVEDAKQLLGFEKRERVVIAVLVVAIGIAAIWLFGGHETASHELTVQIGLTAAGGDLQVQPTTIRVHPRLGVFHLGE